MNPARSIAPKVLAGEFGLVWIYVAGPLADASLAVMLHRFLSGDPNRGRARSRRRKAAALSRFSIDFQHLIQARYTQQPRDVTFADEDSQAAAACAQPIARVDDLVENR
jgi:hypothetical protein